MLEPGSAAGVSGGKGILRKFGNIAFNAPDMYLAS